MSYLDQWRPKIIEAEETGGAEALLRTWVACVSNAEPEDPDIENVIEGSEGEIIFLYGVIAMMRMPVEELRALAETTNMLHWWLCMAERYKQGAAFSPTAAAWMYWRSVQARIDKLAN